MRLDAAVITALEREIADAQGRRNLKKPGTAEYDHACRIVTDLENQLERYHVQAAPQAQQVPFQASPRP